MWKVTLNETLTLYANTHTPSTGAAVDADAAPGYRIYEGTTTAPILTGNLALQDDANTTGFYSVDIAVTAANGFEAGKTYCARITGVVGGVTGASLFFFSVTTRGLDDVAYPATTGRSLDVDTSGRTLLQPTQTGVTIPTVTTLTNAPADSSGITTLLTRIAGALTITAGKVDVNDKTGFSLSTGGIQAIFDILTSALTTVGSIGKLLVTNIDAKISTVGGAGAGAISYTITVTKDGNPADGVEVWVTTDIAGLSVAASGTTGAAGTVSFMLDAGSYFAWAQLSNTDFTNPTAFTVS